MSLREFWTNVRIGASLLTPTVSVDSPRLDADQTQSILQSAHIWLTPKSVDGFDAQEFSFLSERERIRLSKCVTQFVTIAEQVPSGQPATERQSRAARQSFQAILEIMRPDRHGDFDAFVIGKTVENTLAGQLPACVKALRFDTGADANGDPAVWIWVEIDDETATAENTRRIREIIEACVRKLGVEHWPYVRFRTSSEQAALQQANAE